jgi:flagellar basal body rod protein FlgG
MIGALETALVSYAAHGEELSRLATKISQRSVDDNVTATMVAMTVNQRAAEASLAVARTADEVSRTLLHVIA